jgi:hypothetical protein
MARVRLDKIVKALRGKVGGMIFRLMPDGSTVASSVPHPRKRKGTPNQEAYRHGTFRDRVQWAKWAHKYYPIYEELAADLPMINAYNLALKDISHPPVIYRVLREGGRILVNAWDEIMVATVRVLVHDENGKLVEVGDAVQFQKDWWEYTPTAAGRITVSVCDLPGNNVKKEFEEPGM